MGLLRVTALDKRFTYDGNATRAIENFSLDIEQGEFVSIVGPSRRGKSTFLHILGGFEKLLREEVLRARAEDEVKAT